MAFVPFTKDDQPTMAAFNEKFQQAIDEAVSRGVKIEVGSYVGTGTYGKTNPNSLTFGFEPKLVLIGEVGWNYFTVLFNGIGIVMAGGSNIKMTSTSFSGKTVSWYNIDEYTGSPKYRVQMNESGFVYHYIAIG